MEKKILNLQKHSCDAWYKVHKWKPQNFTPTKPLYHPLAFQPPTPPEKEKGLSPDSFFQTIWGCKHETF